MAKEGLIHDYRRPATRHPYNKGSPIFFGRNGTVMYASTSSSLPRDRSSQPAYVWLRIDPSRNRLIGEKLARATRLVKEEIEEEARRISLENRFNSNKTGIDRRILKMWTRKIQANAEMCYETIFCYHWALIGHRKTGAFVRACSAILGRRIVSLGNTEAHEAKRQFRRSGGIGHSLESSYKNSAASVRKHLEEEWEIEAKELDLAASTVRNQERTLSADGTGTDNPTAGVTGNRRLGEHRAEAPSAKPTNHLVSLASRRQVRHVDPRKELIAGLKARNPNTTARRICELIDQKIEKAPPILRGNLVPLESWQGLAPGERSWVGLYNTSKTHNQVRSYVNKVPPMRTAPKSSK